MPDQVLLEFAAGTSAQYRTALATQTLLETQTFNLTGRTIDLYRIDGSSSVRQTLGAVVRSQPRVSAAQGNMTYLGAQAQPAPKQDAASDAGTARYVVRKLHLLEAHRISRGDDVLVAVIDSKIDTSHPDLAGVIAGEYDAIGAPAPAHSHGTAIAGTIAANSKLIGVAPKVKLLAVRTFSGTGESAQSTTFNVLKGLDMGGEQERAHRQHELRPSCRCNVAGHAEQGQRARHCADRCGRECGPRSPPLYPAADARVIGVTATDADDKLMPQADRGPQVTVAAPGVEILAAAPDGAYQVTSGTSVAAAHASGVAALLLAARPKLTPAQVRSDLMRSAQRIPGKRTEVGAGVIDALAAIKATPKR